MVVELRNKSFSQKEIEMTIYQEIINQFQKLANAAGLIIIKSNWDEFTHDCGSFTLETREQALAFMMIVPNGYEAELLGPTNIVSLEIV